MVTSSPPFPLTSCFKSSNSLNSSFYCFCILGNGFAQFSNKFGMSKKRHNVSRRGILVFGYKTHRKFIPAFGKSRTLLMWGSILCFISSKLIFYLKITYGKNYRKGEMKKNNLKIKFGAFVALKNERISFHLRVSLFFCCCFLYVACFICWFSMFGTLKQCLKERLYVESAL